MDLDMSLLDNTTIEEVIGVRIFAYNADNSSPSDEDMAITKGLKASADEYQETLEMEMVEIFDMSLSSDYELEIVVHDDEISDGMDCDQPCDEAQETEDFDEPCCADQLTDDMKVDMGFLDYITIEKVIGLPVKLDEDVMNIDEQ